MDFRSDEKISSDKWGETALFIKYVTFVFPQAKFCALVSFWNNLANRFLDLDVSEAGLKLAWEAIKMDQSISLASCSSCFCCILFADEKELIILDCCFWPFMTLICFMLETCFDTELYLSATENIELHQMHLAWHLSLETERRCSPTKWSLTSFLVHQSSLKIWRRFGMWL